MPCGLDHVTSQRGGQEKEILGPGPGAIKERDESKET